MRPPGATSSPSSATSRSRTSSVFSSSCVTASVDSVAAPRRSSARSASDLPAPMPPVRPTNGVLGVAVGLVGFLGGRRLLVRLHLRGRLADFVRLLRVHRGCILGRLGRHGRIRGGRLCLGGFWLGGFCLGGGRFCFGGGCFRGGRFSIGRRRFRI